MSPSTSSFPADSLAAHTGGLHGPLAASAARSVSPVYCFSILAVAEPGIMPRVLELLAKRGLVPQRWHSDRLGPEGEDLAIDLQVTGLDGAASDYIARCLRQIPGIETVLTSEKGLA